MKVLRPMSGRIAGMCLAGLLPLSLFGRSREQSLPDGVCGNPQVMREASQTGQAMAQEALAHGTPWGDSPLNEYVNRLGQNLALSSGSRQVFLFYVLYNPRVNAQSFPGGYIVITAPHAKARSPAPAPALRTPSANAAAPRHSPGPASGKSLPAGARPPSRSRDSGNPPAARASPGAPAGPRASGPRSRRGTPPPAAPKLARTPLLHPRRILLPHAFIRNSASRSPRPSSTTSPRRRCANT